jgi:hypothetical protein
VKYILIIMYMQTGQSGRGLGITTAEFNSAAACHAAAEIWSARASNVRGISVIAECHKGD